MTKDTRISFVHSGIPECTSPIVSYHPDYPEYLGIHGTGFFARRHDAVIFITARHCVTKDPNADIALLASRLLISYTPSGNYSQKDHVEFSAVYTYRHESPDIPGEHVDLVVLIANVSCKSKQHKQLLSRAVKLPPSGEWFDKFCEAHSVQEALSEAVMLPLVVVGYPVEGTETESTPENGVVHQKVTTSGYLKPGFYPHTMGIRDMVWEHDLNGFSGSPVFLQFKNSKGIPQQSLVGVIVTGGNRQAQFIRVSQMQLPKLNLEL